MHSLSILNLTKIKMSKFSHTWVLSTKISFEINSINFLNLESKIINLLLPNFACQHLFNHVIPVNVNT